MDPYFKRLQRELLAANPDLSVMPRCAFCDGLFPAHAIVEGGLCLPCSIEIRQKQQPDGEDRPAA